MENKNNKNENMAEVIDIDIDITEELLDDVLPKNENSRKKLYIILGVVVGACILTALAFFISAQMKASEINKALNLGEKYLAEGKYEEAIIAFDDVIAIEPKKVVAYEGKGSANIGLKNYPEAETQLETAKSIEYTDNGKVLMSDVYINTERKDQGLALLDEISTGQSVETDVVIHASQLYAQMNETDKVIQLIEKKLENTSDKTEHKKLYDELFNAYVTVGKDSEEIFNLLERAEKATGDPSYTEKKAGYCVVIKETYNQEFAENNSSTIIGKSTYTRPVFLGNSEATKKMNSVYDGLEATWKSDDTKFVAASKTRWDELSQSLKNTAFKYNSKYENEVTSTVTSNKNNIISIYQDNYKYNISATHGNKERTSHTFDMQTGEELFLDDVLNVTSSDVSQKITNEFINFVNANPGYKEMKMDKVRSTLSINSPFYLTHKGVCIYYNEYEVGSYAMSLVELVIPYTRTDLVKPNVIPPTQ